MQKPINQLLDDFLSEHQGTAGTKLKYRWNLSAFIRWLTVNANDPGNPTRADILLYVNTLKAQGKSEATVVAYIVSIRQWFNYLEENNIYSNIARKIKASVKDQIFKKKPLTSEQVCKLLSSIDRTSEIGKRDYAIINLMVRMGLRCIEVSRLDASDFYLEGGEWLVRLQRKGMLSKLDIQGLSDKAINPIRQYFEARDPGPGSPAFINYGYHFNHADPRIEPKTISRIVKERLRAIGIDDPLISAHSLRHTAAVTAIREGIDIYNVTLLMCHKDVKTTMIYLRYIKDEMKKKGIAVRAIDNAY